jgi:hypothetical protein
MRQLLEQQACIANSHLAKIEREREEERGSTSLHWRISLQSDRVYRDRERLLINALVSL